MKNIVILISGRGSNMQAIVNAAIPDARIAAVLSNSTTAAGLAWAAERGIATESLNHKDFPSRLAFDQTMMEKIDVYQPDLVVLAGFMRILTPEFCAARVLTVEHRLFPQAVADFVAGRLKIEGNRVFNSERNAEGQTLLA